jgi:acyl-homoserine lactone synthase
MAEIITPANRHLYAHLLEYMFKMRYRVAVCELGWNIPGIQPGYDKDDFDTDETIYIIVVSECRTKVLGCTRLNPTTGPHMLTEVFEHYCDLQPIPRSKRVYECSRYMIERKACGDRNAQTRVRQHLGLALTEYIMSVGATHISWLTHQAFYNHTITVFDTKPLGLPRYEEDDNANYIAAISALNMTTWQRQRENLITDEAHTTFMARPLTPALPHASDDEKRAA